MFYIAMAAHKLNDYIVVNCTSSEIDPKNKCIHFLTHIGRHQTSLSGIISSHIRKVYTSEFNVWYLRTFFDANVSQFIGVPLWTKKKVKIKGQSFTFEFFNANHCPGAVMILMKGDFGSYLYTGNCRYNPAMLDYSSLKPYTQGIKMLDKLYVNAAYLKMEHNFPKRELVIQQVLDFISDHSDEKIYMCTRLLGKEDILFRIALELNEKIYVSPNKLKILNKLGYKSSSFTTEMCLARLRVVDVSELTNVKMKRRRLTEKCIGIIFSACNNNEEKLKKQGIYIFPASDHSSANETKLMMKAFIAKEVYLLNKDSTLSSYIQHKKNISSFPPNPPPTLNTTPMIESYKNEFNRLSNKKKLSLKIHSIKNESQILSKSKNVSKVSANISTNRTKLQNLNKSVNNLKNQSLNKGSLSLNNSKEFNLSDVSSIDHSNGIIQSSKTKETNENIFMCDENARSGYSSSGGQNRIRPQLSPSFPPSVSNILTELSNASGSVEHCLQNQLFSSPDVSGESEPNINSQSSVGSSNEKLSSEHPPSISSSNKDEAKLVETNFNSKQSSAGIQLQKEVSHDSGKSINCENAVCDSGGMPNSDGNYLSPEYPASSISSNGPSQSMVKNKSCSIGHNNNRSQISPSFPPSVSSTVETEQISSSSSGEHSSQKQLFSSPEVSGVLISHKIVSETINNSHSSGRASNILSLEYPPSVSNSNQNDPFILPTELMVQPLKELSNENIKPKNQNNENCSSSGEVLCTGNNDLSSEYPLSSSSSGQSIFKDLSAFKGGKESTCPNSGSRKERSKKNFRGRSSSSIVPKYRPSTFNSSSSNDVFSQDVSKNICHPKESEETSVLNIEISKISHNNKSSPEIPTNKIEESLKVVHNSSSINPAFSSNNKTSCENLPKSSSKTRIEMKKTNIKSSIEMQSVLVNDLSPGLSTNGVAADSSQAVSSVHSCFHSTSKNENAKDNKTNSGHSSESVITSSNFSSEYPPSTSCNSSDPTSNKREIERKSDAESLKLQVQETLENVDVSSQFSCSPVHLFSPSYPPSVSNIKMGRMSEKTPCQSRNSDDPSCISPTESLPGLFVLSEIKKCSLTDNTNLNMPQTSISSIEKNLPITHGTLPENQELNVPGKRKSNFTHRLEVISELPDSSCLEQTYSPSNSTEEQVQNAVSRHGLVSMNLTKVTTQGSESYILMESTCHIDSGHPISKLTALEPPTINVQKNITKSHSEYKKSDFPSLKNKDELPMQTKECKVGDSSLFLSDVFKNKICKNTSTFKIDKLIRSNESCVNKNDSCSMSIINQDKTVQAGNLTISPLRTVEESRINSLFSADTKNKRVITDCVELTLCNDVSTSKSILDFRPEEALMDETTVFYSNEEVVCEVHPRPKNFKKQARYKPSNIYEQTTVLHPDNDLTPNVIEFESQKNMAAQSNCETIKKNSVPATLENEVLETTQPVFQENNKPEEHSSQVNSQMAMLEFHQPQVHTEIVTGPNSAGSESEKVSRVVQSSANSSESLNSLVNKESVRSQRSKRRRKKQPATVKPKFTSLPLLNSSLSSFSLSSEQSQSDQSQRSKSNQSKYFKPLNVTESTSSFHGTNAEVNTENTPPDIEVSTSSRLVVNSTQENSSEIGKDPTSNCSHGVLSNKKSCADMFSSDISADMLAKSSLTLHNQDQKILTQNCGNRVLSQSCTNQSNATIQAPLKTPAYLNLKKLNLSQPLKRRQFSLTLPISQPPLTAPFTTNFRKRYPSRNSNANP